VFLATALAASALLGGCAAWRVDRAAQVATGFASHVLCDDVFISGQDPHTALAERVRPLPGMGLVNWGLRLQVDRPPAGVARVGGRGLRKPRAFRPGHRLPGAAGV
jgi:hypothetical protein